MIFSRLSFLEKSIYIKNSSLALILKVFSVNYGFVTLLLSSINITESRFACNNCGVC